MPVGRMKGEGVEGVLDHHGETVGDKGTLHVEWTGLLIFSVFYSGSYTARD